MGQGGWEISGQSREIDLDFVASAPGNLRSQAVTATLVSRALSHSLTLFLSPHPLIICACCQPMTNAYMRWQKTRRKLMRRAALYLP